MLRHCPPSALPGRRVPRGGGAARAVRCSLAAACVVAVVAGAGPVAAQQDPGVPPSTTDPASTAPSTSTPFSPTSSTAAPSTTVPPAPPVPPVDPASVSQLLASARAAAQTRRDAEIAAAAAAVAAADARTAEAWARMSSLQADAQRAAEATKVDEADVETWRARISAFAASAYMQVGTERDETLTQLHGGTDPEVVSAGNDARRTRIYAGKALGVAKRGLAAAQRKLGAARRDERATNTALEAAQSEVTTLSAIAESARSVEAALRAAPLDVAAEAFIASLSGPGGPTIEGPSLLTADDLAAFVRARGLADPTVDVEGLAAAFIDEGDAEGVRADLAWAQSIVETGWFGFAGSMVDPSDHNYAGIGACDSCSTGFKYASPQLGARAQVQLLKAYADPSLTAARLARPPVGKAPELLGVRGCCRTWMALSGVWATGPQYGVKILTVYNQMMRFAVDRRLAAPAAAPAVPAP
jgi:hypothetical protein